MLQLLVYEPRGTPCACAAGIQPVPASNSAATSVPDPILMFRLRKGQCAYNAKRAGLLPAGPQIAVRWTRRPPHPI